MRSGSHLSPTRHHKGSSPRWRVWGTRLLLAAAVAVGLAYLPYSVLDGSRARKASELRHQHQRTVNASQELAEENARLELEIRALEQDSSALEDIARHELGMVYPDEVIIRIEGEP